MLESLCDTGGYVKQNIVTNTALEISGTQYSFEIQAHTPVGKKIFNKLTPEQFPDAEITKEGAHLFGTYTPSNKETINLHQRLQNQRSTFAIRALLQATNLEGTNSGLFGAFGYEFGNFVQDLPSEDEIYRLFLPSIITSFHEDARSETTFVTCDGQRDEYKHKPFQHTSIDQNATEDMSVEEYKDSVETILKDIGNGRFMQCVLSREEQIPLQEHPFAVYKKLREINPSPYCFYGNFENMQIAGASPEMHIKIKNRQVEVRPIAGTIKRTGNAIEDYNQSVKLLTDPKELAEHTMLVDLERNDMHRICNPKSVEVQAFGTIERHKNLLHTVSRITGTLRPDMDSVDAIEATLPLGTLSGAPKREAQVAIMELEKSKRGFYGGAFGYVTNKGDCNTGIIIRSAICENGYAKIRAGAGIVADSVPDNEAREIALKAEKAKQAIGGKL